MLKKSIKELLLSVSVDFSEADHSYKNRNTGELYTGTTTISGAWRKDFLSPWYAKEVVNELGYFDPKYDKRFKGLSREEKKKKIAEAWDDVLRIKEEISTLAPEEYIKKLEYAKGAAKRLAETAKDNGHIAHSWIEWFIKSIIDPTQMGIEKPVEKEPLNSINAFIDWEQKNSEDIEWLGSEEVVCSDIHKVAGTLDALLNYKSILTIGDIKTSSQISEDYLLQLAGYDLQLAELGLQARQWLIIRTPKDGSPVETLTINDLNLMQFARETFLEQRKAHRFYVYAENKLKTGRGFDRKIATDNDILYTE